MTAPSWADISPSPSDTDAYTSTMTHMWKVSAGPRPKNEDEWVALFSEVLTGMRAEIARAAPK